jgi:hypothetical protein
VSFRNRGSRAAVRQEFYNPDLYQNLARIYLAEFMRLYEHYRARARYIAFVKSGQTPSNVGFALTKDRAWANAHYTPGTPEYRARTRLLNID